MKGIIAGFVLFMLACAGADAQETDADKPRILTNLALDDGESGQIELIQPAQVENLLKLSVANNRLQQGIPGYRIRIFSKSEQKTARQKAEETRISFVKNFPEMEVYLVYNAPNFQIFVGDFRTKNEALYEKKKIEKIFPGAFIISDTINIPK